MIQTNFDLKPFNTFGISVKADRFAAFSSIAQLQECLRSRHQDPLLILGGGSNLLLTKDFHGFVLKNEINGFRVLSENEEEAIVEAGAGEVWHEFVMKCIDLNLSGLENLSLIPGSVGASPMQNIGAYGVEIKDCFESLSAFHIESGELHTFDREACAFGYRESVFKRELKGQYIICTVAFRLRKNAKVNTSYGAIASELEKQGIVQPTIKDVSNAVISIRQSKLPDPKLIGNAGSFFKNPIVDNAVYEAIQKEYPEAPKYPVNDHQCKLAAGWLIEQAGWKGKTIETYGVHKLQALVLVNYGGSTGNQIYDLSSQIISDIQTKFGVTLEREVNIL
ncbi:MAG: UDP-N-acetylmuramate dehydrogenase [Flavobacteriales bacterium]